MICFNKAGKRIECYSFAFYVPCLLFLMLRAPRFFCFSFLFVCLFFWFRDGNSDGHFDVLQICYIALSVSLSNFNKIYSIYIVARPVVVMFLKLKPRFMCLTTIDNSICVDIFTRHKVIGPVDNPQDWQIAVRTKRKTQTKRHQAGNTAR